MKYLGSISNSKDLVTREYADHYGDCYTAASTQEKTVSISGLLALHEGISIHVKFSNQQSYDGVPSLNINSLGAISIKRYGSVNAAKDEWLAGEVVSFYYDGSYWVIEGGSSRQETAHEEPIKVSTITLSTTWTGVASPYTQTVTVAGITVTSNSKVDLQPNDTILTKLINDGISALYISNNNGVLTATSVGAETTSPITIQCSVTEVECYGNVTTIIGNPITGITATLGGNGENPSSAIIGSATLGAAVLA